MHLEHERKVCLKAEDDSADPEPVLDSTAIITMDFISDVENQK